MVICAERLRLADAVREAARIVNIANDERKHVDSCRLDTSECDLLLVQAKKLHWDALAALKRHRKVHKC